MTAFLGAECMAFQRMVLVEMVLQRWILDSILSHPLRWKLILILFLPGLFLISQSLLKLDVV